MRQKYCSADSHQPIMPQRVAPKRNLWNIGVKMAHSRLAPPTAAAWATEHTVIVMPNGADGGPPTVQIAGAQSGEPKRGATAVDRRTGTYVDVQPGRVQITDPVAPIGLCLVPPGQSQPCMMQTTGRTPEEIADFEHQVSEGQRLFARGTAASCWAGTLLPGASLIIARVVSPELACGSLCASTGGIICFLGTSITLDMVDQAHPAFISHWGNKCCHMLGCMMPQADGAVVFETAIPGNFFSERRSELPANVMAWAQAPTHFAVDCISLEMMAHPVIANTGTTLDWSSLAGCARRDDIVSAQRISGRVDPEARGTGPNPSQRPLITHCYPNLPLYAALQHWITAHEEPHKRLEYPWYFPPAAAMLHCSNDHVRLYFDTHTGGTYCTWDASARCNQPLPPDPLDAPGGQPRYIRNFRLEAAFRSYRAAGYNWQRVTTGDPSDTPTLPTTTPMAPCTEETAATKKLK